MISNNLLQYDITNIKLDYNMSNVQLKPETSEKATVTRKTTPVKLEANVKDAFVHIDTTAAQSSMNNDKPEAFAEKKADEAYQKVMAGVKERVSIGNQIGKLHEGATIAAVYKNKFINDELQCQTYTHFIPAAPAEITVDPYDIEINNVPGEMNVDWKAHQFSLGYTQSSFDQVVTQQPNVDVTYVGGYNYIYE